jgi:cobalt-zinc-cadmium resistance protein CzcA
MLNRIIESSLNNRFFVLMATVLVAGLGVYSALHLSIDAVPDLTNVQVQVITEAPALSPLEVDSLLSFPVSGAMSGLPDVEQIRSISKFGVSVVTVVFKEGTDIYRARQLVGERLARAAAAIPPGYGTGRSVSVPGEGDQGIRDLAHGPAHAPRLVHRLPVAPRRGGDRDQCPRR